MKNALIYGFLSALASFLLTLVLFIAGWHTDPTKFGLAQLVGGLGGLVIFIIFVVLGIRAQRKLVPPTQEFSYGNSFLAGFGVGCFSGLFGSLGNLLYGALINPQFRDLLIQSKISQMHEKGLPDAAIENAEKMMHLMMSPVALFISALIGGAITGAIIALIVAAFFTRKAQQAAEV